MVPICAMFLFFQLLTRRFKSTQLLRIVSGLVYTYVGLVMFLTGVNVGFMPAGQLIGAAMPTDRATPTDRPWRMAVWEMEPMETSSTCLMSTWTAGSAATMK